LNVLGPGRLVAPSQEHDEHAGTLGLVDAIPGSDIDLQLAHPFRRLTELTWIAVNEAIHSDLDSRSNRSIVERVDPIPIDLGDLHLHPRTVSHGIRMSSHEVAAVAGQAMAKWPGEAIAPGDPMDDRQAVSRDWQVVAGSEPSLSSILRQLSRALRTFDAGWQLGAGKPSLDCWG
jgi:hypothetical protein